jgi:hypothetical protein
MNTTKRRALVAMPGHALALGMKQQPYDRASAHNMGVYLRLRDQVTPAARLRLLAFAGGK